MMKHFFNPYNILRARVNWFSVLELFHFNFDNVHRQYYHIKCIFIVIGSQCKHIKNKTSAILPVHKCLTGNHL